MQSRRNTRTWVQRGLLAAIVGAVLVFGLRANGSVANELTTVEGAAWLVDPPTGTLVRVNALGQDVTTAVEVAKPDQQLSATQLGAGAVVLNRTDSTVGKIDGANLDYRSGRKLASAGVDLALVGSDSGAFAVDTSDGRLIALDPVDLATRFEATITPQQSTPAVVDGDGRLWAYDAKTGEVIRFDGRSGSVKRTEVADPGVGAQLALVNGRPVLVDPVKREAVRITGGGGVGDRHCLGDGELGTITVAGTSGADSPRLYVLSIETGDLRTVDLDGDGCSMSLQLGDEDDSDGGNGFGQPVALGGRLFVPVLAPVSGESGGSAALSRQVLVVNAAENRIERSIDLSFVPALNQIELFTKGERLWFNDLEGNRAGVLSPAGAVLVVDKVAKRSLHATDTGEGAGAVSGDGDTVPVEGDPSFEPDGTTRATVAAGASPGRAPGDTPGEQPGDGAAGAPPRSQPTTATTTPDRAGATTPAGGSGGTSPPVSVPVATVVPAPAVALPNVTALPAAVPSNPTPAPGVSPGPAARTPGPETRAPAPPVPVTQPSPTEAPVANFTYTPPGDPTTETPITFVDASSGIVDRWTWTFTAPDGTTTSTTGRSVTRTLDRVGAWSVTLTVSNGAGRTDTTRPLQLQVFGPDDILPPTPHFSWNIETPIENEPVKFTDRSTTGRNNPIKSWFWEFGDGTTSPAQNPPEKAYANPGTYTVRLTVENSAGARSTAARITVATPPAPLKPDFSFVSAGATGTTVTAGNAVTFTDKSIGGPTSWSWSFGDGASATGATVTHVFRSTGEVKITLNVANSAGTATIAKRLQVVAPLAPPTAKISEPAAGAKVEVNKALRFVSGSDANATRLSWDWGDGTSSEGTTATKVWTSTGTFTVRLTASNAAGATSATLAIEVTAVPPPVPLVPRFTTSPVTSAAAPAVVGEVIRFVNTSTGPGSFSWNFGDGATSSDRDPSYTYKKAGTFHVTLTMIDGARKVTTSADVHVGPAPVPLDAKFDYSPKNPTAGQAVTFVDQSSGTPIRWTWSFGDGSASIEGPGAPGPQEKIFATAGTYQVALTLADRNGTIDTETVSVAVQAAPRAKPNASLAVTPADGRQVGRAITFTDTTPADHPLTTPVFTFTDAAGGATTATAAPGARSVDHVFTQAGTYEATVRVCWADDPANCADSTPAVPVTISSASTKPVAEFSVSGDGVVLAAQAGRTGLLLANQTMTFTATQPNSSDTQYTWTINDRTSTGPVVSNVVLATVGSLNVSLTVSNDAGSASGTMTYLVLASTVAQIDVPPSPETVNPVHFTDVTPGLPAGVQRRWNFGDGTPVQEGGSAIEHTYEKAGTYTVELSVWLRNIPQPLVTASVPVAVRATTPKPVIQANGHGGGEAAVTIAPNEEVTFTDVSATAAKASPAWTWSDGAPGSTAAALTRRFTSAGEYILTLTSVLDGERGTASVTVRVVAPATTPS